MSLAAAQMHDVLTNIMRDKRVTPDDVLALRREVWADGLIGRDEAELLFRIDEALEAGCAEWRDFFVEAISGHLVDQAKPQGYVSEQDCAWFEGRIAQDGAVRGATELEALVKVLERAVFVPHRLEMMALATVRDAILRCDGEILGDAAMQPRVIGDPEVALLRRVLYAKAGARSDGVSRDEAELLIELNDATAASENCAAWTALFVNGVANYLLVQSGYEPPSRERMKEIDRWLNAPSRGIAGFRDAMRPSASKSRGWLADAAASFRSESLMDQYYAVRNVASEIMQAEAEAVDTDEAAWLTDRLQRDGVITPNEKALLAFLKAEGAELSPALQRLMERAG